METPILVAIISASASVTAVSITIIYQRWIEKRKWALTQEAESKKELRLLARTVAKVMMQFLMMLERYLQLQGSNFSPEKEEEAEEFLQKMGEKLSELEIEILSSLAELAILSPKVYKEFKQIENEIHTIIGKAKNGQVKNQDKNRLRELIQQLPSDVSLIGDIQPTNFTKALELFNS